MKQRLCIFIAKITRVYNFLFKRALYNTSIKVQLYIVSTIYIYIVFVLFGENQLYIVTGGHKPFRMRRGAPFYSAEESAAMSGKSAGKFTNPCVTSGTNFPPSLYRLFPLKDGFQKAINRIPAASGARRL